MARTLSKRADQAIALVQTGAPIEKALISAGYSKSFARRDGRASKALTAQLDKARASYTRKYLRRCGTIGLDGDLAVDTLFKIVKTGRDFDKVQALKEHHRIILRCENNVSRVENTYNFMVPMPLDREAWIKKTEKYRKVVEVDGTRQQKMEEEPK